MEEILALQRQLAAVQEQTQTAKLSDRNIVEIIESLIKNYDLKLIYTLDGREYITPEYLEKQIKEVVLQHRRINIVELPKILNVGIEKIDPRVEALCKKTGEVFCLDGQLFTNSYLDDIAEEINEELQIRHKIQISELPLKYSLPHEYLVKVLSHRLGTMIQGNIQNNTLITLSYQNTIKSQLRGILRACLRPISVGQIKKNYGYEEVVISSIIEELIANEEIDGTFKQGSFISTRFMQNQDAIIRNFYQQNSYIEYDFLQKNLYVSKPKEVLKQLFGENCIFLENCCFNKEALENIKEQILEVLNTEGSIDVSNLLPSILDESEIETLITKHMDLKNFELRGTLIVSTDFLEKCVLKFRDKIINLIYKAPQKLIEESNEDTKKKTKGKKKKGDSEDALFSKDEVTQHLKETKMLPNDYDPDFEETFYALIKERLQKYYESIKVELFESKKSLSTDIISEMQTKLDERTTAIAFIARSIQEIENKYTNVDMFYLKSKLNNFLRPVVENMILLYCKKYSLQVSSNLFAQVEEKKEMDAKGRIKLDETPIFKSSEAITTAIDVLPKDLAKLTKEFFALVNDKKSLEAVEFLKKNALDLGLKPINIDKKNEKNFMYAQKYFTKEDLQGVGNDPKYTFFLILSLKCLDSGLYLGLNFEDKAVSTYTNLVLGDPAVDEETKKSIQKVIENYNENDKELESLVKKIRSTLSK